MPRAKTPRSTTFSNRTTSSAIPPAPVGNGSRARLSLEEEIRRRAYELYEQRGRIPGRECEDWLLAEQEIVARYQQPGM